MKEKFTTGVRITAVTAMLLGVAACGSDSKKDAPSLSPISSTSSLSPVSPSNSNESSKSSNPIKTLDKSEQAKAKKIEDEQKTHVLEKQNSTNSSTKSNNSDSIAGNTSKNTPSKNKTSNSGEKLHSSGKTGNSQTSKNMSHNNSSSPLKTTGVEGSHYVSSNSGGKAAKYYSSGKSNSSYKEVAKSVSVTSRPVSLTIPSIGLYHATILSRGLVGGQLVPPPGYVQWYTGTVKPGDNGISVLAGHVTYYGPDVLYSLNLVPVGGKITVNYANGMSKTFTVYHKETDNKNNLQYDQRVWGRSTSPVLAIITCDKNSAWSGLHHVNNYVLWAK